MHLSDRKCTSVHESERTRSNANKERKGEESERRKAIKRTIGDGLNHIKNCSLCNFPFCFSTSISLLDADGDGRKSEENVNLQRTSFRRWGDESSRTRVNEKTGFE